MKARELDLRPDEGSNLTAFQASGAFPFFDYFRVPYERFDPDPRDASPSPFEAVRPVSEGERVLYWCPAASVRRAQRRPCFEIASIPIVGTVLDEAETESALDRIGGTWEPTASILGEGGTRIGSVWTEAEGSVLLPFDPAEVMRLCWTEEYLDLLGSRVVRRVRRSARAGYYSVRPLLPRSLQIALRRRFSEMQARTTIPRWPIETALHDFYELLFDLLCDVTAGPVPAIASWPDEHDWAFVLTHDVEKPSGVGRIHLLKDVERRHSYRSSWNFVPSQHGAGHDEAFAALRAEGCEIGVHGWLHDGRDIARLRRRLPGIRDYGETWHAVGFRSPATLRDWQAMTTLGFEYDSSYSDTAPYEPQPGGSWSWLPYFVGDLVELPITLTQDHTIFEILDQEDGTLWNEKADLLRERGGMALVITHPDYADDPRLVDAYEVLLERFSDDATAWKALPREVAEWWRARAASTIRLEDGEWRVRGPAEQRARVELRGAREPAPV